MIATFPLPECGERVVHRWKKGPKALLAPHAMSSEGRRVLI